MVPCIEHLGGKLSRVLKGFFFFVISVVVTILVYLHAVLPASHSQKTGRGTSHHTYFTPDCCPFLPSTQMNWGMYVLFWNFPWFFSQSPVLLLSCSRTTGGWSRRLLESAGVPGREDGNADFTPVTSVSTTARWLRCCYFSHFTDEKTESQNM